MDGCSGKTSYKQLEKTITLFNAKIHASTDGRSIKVHMYITIVSSLLLIYGSKIYIYTNNKMLCPKSTDAPSALSFPC